MEVGSDLHLAVDSLGRLFYLLSKNFNVCEVGFSAKWW